MPNLKYIQHARKDYPEEGIKKGESYYRWGFRYPPRTFRSKTYPKKSQLEDSDMLRQIREIEESLENRFNGLHPTDFELEQQTLIDDLQSLIDEMNEHLEALPDHWKDTGPGEKLTTRIEAVESWISDIESVQYQDDPDDEENIQNFESAIEDIKATSYPE